MKVIVISGPTASGKTQMAMDLARQFGGEIVNFDSLLLYQEINIGTAKPSPQELSEIPHHMVSVCSISNPMNASEYANMARPLVEKILAEKKLVYVVGGSGFYLQALLKGMYDSPTTPREILQRSDELYGKEGIIPFLEILKQEDPESFNRYHENDHYRVRRAVEHWWAHGTPLFEKRRQKDQENAELSKGSIHDWDLLHLHLDLPKDEHQKIIQNRTQKMISEGLVEEVRSLLQSGFTGKEKPLQSIGYKETLDYLSGNFKDTQEYVERIVISTRQLAKSQRTWFKRDQTKIVFHPLRDQKMIFKKVQEFI